MFSKVTVALALVSSAFAATHIVVVGQDNTLTYTPNQLAADVGDIVTFQFVSKNHTATTTTFENPCPPPEGGVGPDGFDAGFHPVTPPDTSEFSITVQDTDPKFVACRQTRHCGLGMNFVLNPTDEFSYDAFHANALADPTP